MPLEMNCSLQAYNGAGLSLATSSWAIVVDTTPPVAGQVHDDDFQADVTSLFVKWNGFEEVHSTIREYFVSAGTCPFCDNIQAEQPVGITQGQCEHVINYMQLNLLTVILSSAHGKK